MQPFNNVSARTSRMPGNATILLVSENICLVPPIPSRRVTVFLCDTTTTADQFRRAKRHFANVPSIWELTPQTWQAWQFQYWADFHCADTRARNSFSDINGFVQVAGLDQ